MYERSIFPSLKAHLSDNQVTVITGMRRVGKTTTLKFLLDQIPHSNPLSPLMPNNRLATIIFIPSV